MFRLFRKGPNQSTFCYCPMCRFEMIDSDSFVHEEHGDTAADNEIVYVCRRCSCLSVWNFDLFPVPVLMRHEVFSEMRILRDV